jgi:hypothetical protein
MPPRAPAPCGAPLPAARDRPTWTGIGAILLSGQGVVKDRGSGRLCFIADSRAQGRPDGVEQSVAAERLSEECYGAGLEGSPARLFVAVRGQNDNRDPGARGGQMPEEVEAIHPGHPQIEHKTAGVRSMSRLQELFRGGERLDPEADR